MKELTAAKATESGSSSMLPAVSAARGTSAFQALHSLGEGSLAQFLPKLVLPFYYV